LPVDVIVAAPPRSPLGQTRGVHLITPDTVDGLLAPSHPHRLVVVDDSEAFVDSPGGAALERLAAADPSRTTVVVAGRPDELALTYRGLAHDVRKARCAVLLQPRPADGEIVGMRLPHRRSLPTPGRGFLIGDPAWGEPFQRGPVPIQIAVP
jgi:DNA segregation ATPase FtsK/SpoIIIE, S-DNA-T family